MKLSHRVSRLAGVGAVFVVWVVLGVVGMPSTTFAQTNTPTPTLTATPTLTRTPTLGTKATPGTSDTNAFQYGSFRVPTPVCPTPASNLVTIPGLKQGDLITVYPSDAYRGGLSYRILTNNTLRLNLACTTAGNGNYEYVWWSRTQNNCQGAPNCRPAPTVTPTP